MSAAAAGPGRPAGGPSLTAARSSLPSAAAMSSGGRGGAGRAAGGGNPSGAVRDAQAQDHTIDRVRKAFLDLGTSNLRPDTTGSIRPWHREPRSIFP